MTAINRAGIAARQPGPLGAWADRGRQHAGLIGRLAVLLALLVLFALNRGYFVASEQIPSLFSQAQVFALVAIGLTAPMLAGELDLSVGSMAAASSVLAIELHPHLGLVPAILVASAAGALLGATQGWVIARLGISSLVLTVCTYIGLRGVAYLLSAIPDGSEGPVGLADPQDTVRVVNTFSRQTFWLRPSALIAIGMLIGVGLLLGRTRTGREISAIGGARAEALSAGVQLRRPLTAAFALSGGCAALAGALSGFDGGSADPSLLDPQLLLGVTAALVGGVSVYGGRGRVGGVALGVLVLAALRSGMQDLAKPHYVTDLATGALLSLFLLVELVSTRTRMHRGRDLRRQAEIDARLAGGEVH